MSVERNPFTSANNAAKPPQGESSLFNEYDVEGYEHSSRQVAGGHEKGSEQITNENLADKEKDRGESSKSRKGKEKADGSDNSDSDDDDGSSDSDDDSDDSSGSDDDSGDSDDDSSGSDDDSSGSDSDSDSSGDSTSSKRKKATNSTPSSPTDGPTPKATALVEGASTPTTIDQDPNNDTPSNPHEDSPENMLSKILKAQLDLSIQFEEEVKARKAERKELWGMLDVLNHNIKCLLEADDIGSENMAYIKGSLKYVVDCFGPRRKAQREVTRR